MFKGVFTALVTPFRSDGAVDEETLRKLVDWQIEEGINGLVPMGTTGESPTLDHKEHMNVIKIVVDQARGRVPVIAGTGSNSTQEAVEMTLEAKKIGATASLQVAPYYNKPTQEGLFRHFTLIAEKTALPLVIYNIPGRSGININTETMLRLADNPHIVAAKEASGSLPQMMDLIAKKPESFNVLSGDDNLTLPLVTLGGTGVISVASNLIPSRMVHFVKAALAGDFKTARILHYKLLPLFKVLFIETNPIPVKAAMAAKQLIQENYRLPMCPLEEGNKKQLLEVLKNLEI